MFVLPPPLPLSGPVGFNDPGYASTDVLKNIFSKIPHPVIGGGSPEWSVAPLEQEVRQVPATLRSAGGMGGGGEGEGPSNSLLEGTRHFEALMRVD